MLTFVAAWTLTTPSATGFPSAPIVCHDRTAGGRATDIRCHHSSWCNVRRYVQNGPRRARGVRGGAPTHGHVRVKRTAHSTQRRGTVSNGAQVSDQRQSTNAHVLQVHRKANLIYLVRSVPGKAKYKAGGGTAAARTSNQYNRRSEKPHATDLG